MSLATSDDEPPSTPPARWRPAPFRALRHRNYRLYFVGQIVSWTGSWVQNTALAWVTWQITQQSLWTAIIAASQMLPALFLGPWGGSLADRLPRHPLILATQSAQLVLALVLVGVVLAGWTNPWVLLCVGLLTGVVNAADLPARLAFIHDMVGREDLTNAVALNSLVFNVARTTGPALGAVLLGTLGPEHCFLFNALSFGVVLFALVNMDVAGLPRPVAGQPRGSLWDGFRDLGNNRPLLLVVLMASAMALFGWPALTLFPALAVEELGADETGFGALLSCIGGGAMAAAFLSATFSTRTRRVPLLATGVALASASLLVLSSVTTLAAAMACCCVLGGGLILFFANGQAVLQLGATDRNRGKLMGIWSMVLSGSVPLGHLLAGPAADRWGVPTVLALQSAGIAVAGIGVLGFVLTTGARRG